MDELLKLRGGYLTNRLSELLTLLNEDLSMFDGAGTSDLEDVAMEAYRLHEQLLRLQGLREIKGIATSGYIPADVAHAMIDKARLKSP